MNQTSASNRRIRGRHARIRISLYSIGLVACLSIDAARVAASEFDGYWVPVELVIENLEAQLAKSPDDAQLHWQLADVYSTRFATSVKAIRVKKEATPEGGEKLSLPYGFERLDLNNPDLSVTVTDRADKVSSLFHSCLHYEKATQLAPDVPEYWMGLAYLAHLASKMADRLFWPFASGSMVPDSVAKLQRAWEDKAIEAYRMAYIKDGSRPIFSLGVLAIEAGEKIIDLLEERDGLSGEELKMLKRLRRALVQVKRDFERPIGIE